MVSKKHVFWQALLSAILIFGIGLLLGVALENSRNNEVQKNLLNSEINVLDSQVLAQIPGNFKVDCKSSTEQLTDFADSIYSEAKLLEQYDSSSELTDTLKIVHRKYDLLRVILWTQSINLKKQCKSDFHTVVYIYQYDEPDVIVRSEQITFGRFLEDLKQKYGNKIILIPVAGDLKLNSIDLVKNSYGIDSYPVIILDEKTVIRSVDDLDKIEGILFK